MSFRKSAHSGEHSGFEGREDPTGARQTSETTGMEHMGASADLMGSDIMARVYVQAIMAGVIKMGYFIIRTTMSSTPVMQRRKCVGNVGRV